jgi:hypothetical protein
MCEIKVLEYRGKTSGFQTQERTLYAITLINGDVSKRITNSWGSIGGFDKEDADRIANEWHRLLGWPIVQYVEKTVTLRTIERKS